MTNPLGKSTHIEIVGKVVFVGGGTGIAVLLPITRALKELGNDVTCIFGARDKDLLIMKEQMQSASHDLKICTDDDSHGHHGFVTEVLEKLLKGDDIKLVVTISPFPMMKAMSNITKGCDVTTLRSLNPIMVDGTGIYGYCRVTVVGTTQFACIDGPEFDAHQVDFDQLILRLRSYETEERKTHDDYCISRDTKGMKQLRNKLA